MEVVTADTQLCEQDQTATHGLISDLHEPFSQTNICHKPFKSLSCTFSDKEKLKKKIIQTTFCLFFNDFLLVPFDLGANTILNEWKTSLCCALNYFSLFPSIALFILAHFPKA